MRNCLMILFFCAWGTANGTTLFVGKESVYKTIAAALSAAASGDTVLVDQGVYHEKNLVISKKVVLLGHNHPVLDGEKLYEIISVKADGVVVDGFKIVHSGVSSVEDFGGIKIYNSRDVVIQNNILEDTFFGIYTEGVLIVPYKTTGFRLLTRPSSRAAMAYTAAKATASALLATPSADTGMAYTLNL